MQIQVSVQSSCSQDDNKRGEFFHIRVITKPTKVDTLFDSGSQVNLIFEEVVKKPGLATIAPKNTYAIVWVTNDAQL